MNWTLSPATVFAASPVVPVMVIDKVEDAVPMAKALAAGGITVFEITLRTAAALDAIRAIRAAMPEALVGAGTILNPGSSTVKVWTHSTSYDRTAGTATTTGGTSTR